MGKIRITRKLLADYKHLKREIPILEQELIEMQDGDNGFGNSTIFDYRTGEPRPQSVVGFDWKLYGQRQRALEHKRAKCQAVEEWINAIDDGQTRCVFKMFYIDGMTWDKIAIRTGYSKSLDYPRLMIRDRFLKKCGIN